jgi:hypothetical protein
MCRPLAQPLVPWRRFWPFSGPLWTRTLETVLARSQIISPALSHTWDGDDCVRRSKVQVLPANCSAHHICDDLSTNFGFGTTRHTWALAQHTASAIIATSPLAAA